MSATKPKEQNAALIKIIKENFPVDIMECTSLQWLRVLSVADMPRPLKSIHDALNEYRGRTDYTTPGYKLP